MKIGFQLVRPVIIAIFALLGWWTAMFWPHPIERPAESKDIASNISYGYPWEFGIDEQDVASGFPCNIDIWKPWSFAWDGLIWASVMGCGAVILWWITKVANPNG